MIQFKRERSSLQVLIDYCDPEGRSWRRTFAHTLGSDEHAMFVRHAMEKQLADELARLKREYYNAGWRDAKAKTVKRTYFFGGWQ